MKAVSLSALLASALLAAAPSANWANTVVWESAKSLIDTTDYSSIGPYYWFANFGNPNPVTGAATDDHEARNLPSWIHLETRHAFIGKDDSGVNSDGTNFTGYSFFENDDNTEGGITVGGQLNFNELTLPNGSTGISGQVLEPHDGPGSTTSQLAIRILAGAPESFRIWVVTDNGAGDNFNIQSRLRVNLRGSLGPPTYNDDIDRSEDEAHPGGPGSRLSGQSNSIAESSNGTADAWAFLLSGINEHDIVTIRPTSPNIGFTPPLAGFAGLIIQPVPEPAAGALLTIGAAVIGLLRIRRRG